MADNSRSIFFNRNSSNPNEKSYEDSFKELYSEEVVAELFKKSGPLAKYPDLYDFYRKHPAGFSKMFEEGGRLEKATKLKEFYEKHPDNFIDVFKKGGRLADDVEANKLYTKDSKGYAYAYGMQEEIAGDDKGKNGNYKSEIIVNEKDELALAVEVLSPSSFKFNIVDGRIDLSSNKMSEEQMKEFISFFYARGVSNFTLPQGIDPELKQDFEAAHKEVLKEPKMNILGGNVREVTEGGHDNPVPVAANSNDVTPPVRPSNASGNDDNVGEVDAPVASPAVDGNLHSPELANVGIVADRAKKKEEKKKDDRSTIQQVDDALKGFMVRQGKHEDSTYTVDRKFDGSIAYRLYGKEGAIKDDGREKDGVPQHTYDAEIRAKEVEDKSNPNKKRLVMTFGTPNGKDLPGNCAIEILNIMKARGNTHIRFGTNMTDGEKKAFREACGSIGVVPIGITLNEHQVKKMLGEAENSLSSEDLQKYKLRLAKQLRKNIAEKGDSLAGNRLEATINNLEGSVKYNKFNDFACDVLKHIENTKQGKERQEDGTYVKTNTPVDSVKIIATGSAYAELIDEYAAGVSGYESLLPAMKENLMQIYLNKVKEKEIEVANDIKLQAPLNNEASKAVNAVKMSTQESVQRACMDVQEACGSKIRTVNLSGGIYDEEKYGKLKLKGKNRGNDDDDNDNEDSSYQPRRNPKKQGGR